MFFNPVQVCTTHEEAIGIRSFLADCLQQLLDTPIRQFEVSHYVVRLYVFHPMCTLNSPLPITHFMFINLHFSFHICTVETLTCLFLHVQKRSRLYDVIHCVFTELKEFDLYENLVKPLVDILALFRADSKSCEFLQSA